MKMDFQVWIQTTLIHGFKTGHPWIEIEFPMDTIESVSISTPYFLPQPLSRNCSLKQQKPWFF